MTKQEITEMNEQIGRIQFINYTSTQQPDWDIKKFSKDLYSSYDVAYTTGTTKDFVIGEIKYRKGYNSNAFDNWLLEQSKYKVLQDLKKETQLKHPDKNIFIHYINFYPDKPDQPRIWDITNLDNEFKTLELPSNSNTATSYERDTQARYLHNNDTINPKF